MKKKFGRKVNMSQVIGEEGNVISVTLIRLSEIKGLKIGMPVTITGFSKGKGFTGVMKRWGFSGGPATHGQSDRQRSPGSIGASATPGRVLLGKKMAGRSGGKKVSIKGLRVIGLREKEGIIEVSGAVPGARNSALEIAFKEESEG